VRVALSHRGGAVEVEVSDTGAGIAPEDLPRVFDRFHRGDATRAAGTEPGGAVRGVGLGLAIARGIVGLHGGTLAVASAPGRGTTFRFSVTLS
jgi:signal transduction histidine kinase